MSYSDRYAGFQDNGSDLVISQTCRSRIRKTLSEKSVLTLAGWGYLGLGIVTGLAILIFSLALLLMGTRPIYHWTTIVWAGGLVGVSGLGCWVVFDLRRIERELEAVVDQDVDPKRINSHRDVWASR